MRTKLLSVLFIICSFNLVAKEEGQACNPIEGFVPFKAGVEAAKAGNQELAFDIFCNLSFEGDYRAQFRLAKYYDGNHPSTEETNKVYALVWASLSNALVRSTNRARYIENLTQSMSNEEIAQVNKLLIATKGKIPTGIRFDQQFEPLDLDVLLKKHKRKTAKKAYTGSRIKKDKPPRNLGIYLVN